MAVGRVKQNLWRESWVGAIATAGDPSVGRAVVDGRRFTYVTWRFRGTLLNWDEVPALSEDFARADERIRERVIQLVDELVRKQQR